MIQDKTALSKLMHAAGGTKTDGQFTRIELIKVDTDEWDTFGGVV